MTRIPFSLLRGEERTHADALREGRIAFQICRSCGATVWYLRTVCPSCMSAELVLAYAAGGGTLHALTTLYRAGDPARADDLPYTVGLVDLDEGVRVIGDILPGAAALGIGARVIAHVDEAGLTFAAEAP